MGSLGSDAAIEVADIVLMADDLTKLSEAVKIAKDKKNCYSKCCFSFGCEILCTSISIN